MAIKFYNDGTDFVPPAKGRIAVWVRRAVETEGLRLGAVNYIFCSPERHLEINRQFLGHDYATDVITFDYTANGVVSGDIFIDPVTVEQNAAERFISPAVEMRRVLIHGVLHLCGYGDRTRKEQRMMRAKEDLYLMKYYEAI